MGTNFYLRRKDMGAKECPTCHHVEPAPDPLHIGKSSSGWCFGLHVYPEDEWSTEEEKARPKSLEDWKVLFADERYVIDDEYGAQISVRRLLDIVTQRDHPRGLNRHPIDGHCIGHGEGTWDLITGYFS